MFIVSSKRTMAGAKCIVVDEGFQPHTPRRERLNALSREWQARQQARQPLAENKPKPPEPPVPEHLRIPKTDAQKIIADIAHKHGTSYSAVISRSRSRFLVKVRTEAIWALKDWNPTLSLPQIGRLVGGRDHTTILHALRKREVR
ncbi:MAG: hypothetical protein EOS65_02570 [Mesorhizobium sp.]|uniref:helix-turn-helix domain-containing protein n=1 Tax=Mesorhizobium sp. TaxID=1871066 RepID=UPI000FE60C49|nr:helix-turn-helix domain-containing protein [Mesorhizobium sp.]RWF44279.1 MAG: hypothetical protein EOS65_02570 [Mesorhizobium sp.]